MNCKDVEKLVVAFLDGELTNKEQDLVREHLATCQHCREEMEALAATQDNLRRTLELRAAKYSPSPSAWDRLRQQITEEEQPEVTVQGLARSLLKAIKSVGSLFPRRLSWKTGLIGILTLALVASLAVTIPPLFRQSTQALAADIALNSPEVQAALGDREVGEVEVVGVVDDRGQIFVVLRVEPDYILIAEVDMGIKEVIQVHVLELTDEKKQEILDIAGTDPRVQDLLGQGAQVSSFFPIHSIKFKEIVGPDGEIYKEGLVEFMVDMRMELGEKEYSVMVDLTNGEVVYLISD